MAKKFLTKWYTFQLKYWTLLNKYLHKMQECFYYDHNLSPELHIFISIDMSNDMLFYLASSPEILKIFPLSYGQTHVSARILPEFQLICDSIET